MLALRRPRTAAGRQQARHRKPRSAKVRALQVAIWGALTIIVALGFHVSASASASAATSPASTGYSYAAGSTAGDPATSPDPSTTEGNGPAAAPTVPAADISSDRLNGYVDPGSPSKAWELLPMQRWSSANLASDAGWGQQLSVSAPSMFADILFGAASTLWSGLLLPAVHYGMTLDPVRAGASKINQGFAGMIGGLNAGGLVAIVLIAILVVVAGRILRGKRGGSIGLIIACLVPLGAAQFLAQSASTDSGNNVPPKGSPAWLAISGNNVINSIGNQVSSAFGAATGWADGSGTAVAAVNSSITPSCDYYVARLVSTYEAAAAASADPNGADQSSVWGQVTGSGTTTTTQAPLTDSGPILMINQLWMRSFYQNWTTAQFGNMGEGNLMACHQLETDANISPVEQAKIAGTDLASSPYSGYGVGPFAPFGGKKGKQAQMFFWAACATENGVTPRPGWVAGGLHASDNAPTPPADACTKWKNVWAGSPDKDISAAEIAAFNEDNSTSNKLQWGDDGSMHSDTTWDGSGGQAQKDAVGAVRSTVDAYWGHNGGQRFFQGLLALLTAGLYTWCLGVMALGVGISQIGLALMMVMLPVTLVLMALPSGRNGPGLKLLRLTGGFFGAKLVLVLAISLLLLIINMMDTMLGTIISGANSGGSILNALVPLAAMWVLRKVLKTMGFGNITSLGGALGMATVGAAKLGGDKKMAAALSGKFAGASPNALRKNAKQRLTNYRGNQERRERELESRMRRKDRKQIQQEIRESQKAAERQALPAAASSRAAAASAQARARIAALAGNPGLLGGAAVFNPNAGKAVGSRAEAVASLQARRAELAAKMGVAAGADAGLALPSAANTEFWANDLARLGAEAQLDGLGAPLTDLQISSERARIAQALGCDESRVLLGAAGAPPMILPDIVNGRVQLPQLSSKEATIANAGNPLNFMSADVISRGAGESDTHYHARLAASLLAVGGIDDSGNLVDMLETIGIDPGTASGRGAILSAAAGMAPLRQLALEPSIEDRQDINGALRAMGISYDGLADTYVGMEALTHAGVAYDNAAQSLAAASEQISALESVAKKFETTREMPMNRRMELAGEFAQAAEADVLAKIRDTQISAIESQVATLLSISPDRSDEITASFEEALTAAERQYVESCRELAAMTGGLVQEMSVHESRKRAEAIQTWLDTQLASVATAVHDAAAAQDRRSDDLRVARTTEARATTVSGRDYATRAVACP